jgi:hypothetical protein
VGLVGSDAREGHGVSAGSEERTARGGVGSTRCATGPHPPHGPAVAVRLVWRLGWLERTGRLW